jgi:hypothetical protein
MNDREVIVKKQILSLVFVILFISGCQPSEATIQTAIAQTQIANPTLTIAPTVTITFTALPSPSPTPDLQIISIEPKEFLLAIDALPGEGKYYLPNVNWISPHRNSEIIQDRGAEAGEKYINETGRVDGWFVYYKSGTSNKPVPDTIYDNVILFNSIEGPRVYMEEYAGGEDDYTERTTDLKIGDITKVFEKNESGNISVTIEFSYRNYVHRVAGLDMNGASEKVIEDIARELLEDLQNAQLVNP